MSRHLASGIRPKPYVSASEPALNPTTLVSQPEAAMRCDLNYVMACSLPLFTSRFTPD